MDDKTKDLFETHPVAPSRAKPREARVDADPIVVCCPRCHSVNLRGYGSGMKHCDWCGWDTDNMSRDVPKEMRGSIPQYRKASELVKK